MKKKEIKIVALALASFLMLVCITAASPDSTFRFIDTTPANYTQEQEFTLGVLAINTHKSIYLPDETAFIGIAVLDNEGHMVCDAAVTLTITDPGNKKTVLSTGNGLIKVSPECCVYGVTNLPDYYTNYTVDGAGTYVMNLTAVTADGTKSITDVFSVQNSVDFDVARDGATRIYPPVSYVMNFTIKANKNYTGLIKEYVPASFVITPQDGLTVTTVGDTKVLTWNKNLISGETYNIYYEFDAPDVSPYLFLLGELQIGDWKEARQWQIASDAVSQTKFPSTAETAAEAPYDDYVWATPSNVGANDSDFASSDSKALGVGGYMHVLNATNYSFSIPTGATIDGIKVEHERVSVKGPAIDALVQLIKGGTRQGDNKNTGALYPIGVLGDEDETIAEFGGATDLWGLSCSASDINAADFGVAVSATCIAGGKDADANIDFLRITVYYTPPWESYNDSGHTTECNDFDSYESEHTVYMNGSGFTPSTAYRIIFWDGGGANRKTDDKNSDANGILNSSHTFNPANNTAGTWNVTVYDDPGYSPVSHDPADSHLVADDTFTVLDSAIPEFSTVIAAIAVCMLCAVAYIVMRRNKYGKE